jgi:hypothetical protein
MSTPLPSNSYIIIDNFRINAPTMVVSLWEVVLKAAIKAGDVMWVRLRDADGMHAVLVTPHTKVIAYHSLKDIDDLGGDRPDLTGTPQTNHAVWIEKYIPRDSDQWRSVELLGLDKDVDALDDEVRRGERAETS